MGLGMRVILSIVATHSWPPFLTGVKKEHLNKYVVNKDLQTMARMELHHVRRLFEFHEPSILMQLAETK